MHLISTDVGRPFGDFAKSFVDEELLPDARRVLEQLGPIEREVRGDTGQWFIRRVLPYRTHDDRIEGVVITFAEVSGLKDAKEQLDRRLLQQTAMADLGQRASASPLDLAGVLAEGLQVAKQTLAADAAALWEPTGRGTLRLRHGVGWPTEVGPAEIAATADTPEGLALTLRQRVVFPAGPADTRFRSSPLLATHGLAGGMATLLYGGERAAGVLAVYVREPKGFDEHDGKFLQGIGNTLALATQRAVAEDIVGALQDNLESRVTRRTSAIRLLQQVTMVANESHNANDALGRALELICNGYDWFAGHVWRFTERDTFVDSGIWFVRPAYNAKSLIERTRRTLFTRGDSFIGKMADRRRPEVLRDPSQDPRLGEDDRVRNLVALRVSVGLRCVAVLEFFGEEDVKTDETLVAGLEALGWQLARVFERQDLERQVAGIADHERRVIGRELHDSIGQQLTGVALVAQSLGRSSTAAAWTWRGWPACSRRSTRPRWRCASSPRGCSRSACRRAGCPMRCTNWPGPARRCTAWSASSRDGFDLGGRFLPRQPPLSDRPGGGEQRHQACGADQIIIGLTFDGTWVTLSVADDGAGLSGAARTAMAWVFGSCAIGPISSERRWPSHQAREPARR